MTGGTRGDDGEPGAAGSRVVPAHAELGPRAQVLADRRALYRLAVELGRGAPAPDDAVLDHPVSRYRIGEVLAGRAPAAALQLPAAAELAADRDGPGAVGIVAEPPAAGALAPALRSVAAEAAVPGGTVGLITRPDGGRHDRAVADVRAGLRRAAELVPELFADLVGHVALIAVLDPARSGAVVSASSRHMPGLLLVRPGGPLEVAESIVHEAAHQRLFDLAMTRDLLRGEFDRAPGFRPSWRATTWPIEQTLAAFHAYACLAELAAAAPATERTGAHTVLPDAAARSAEIGRWLCGHADLLGPDADRLVRTVLGLPRIPAVPAHEDLPVDPAGATFRARDCRVVATGAGRCLVGVPGAPPRLLWLQDDAGAVLEALHALPGPIGLDRLSGSLRGRFPADASTRVSRALGDLVHADLAAVSG